MTDRPEFDRIIAHTYLSRGPYLDSLTREDIFKTSLGVPFSFEIHSSINGMYRYGSITFDDRYGIRETLPLTGNEIITLAYKNSHRGSLLTDGMTVIHFNIFDIEETQISTSADDRFTQKALKFHVIEAPFFLLYNDTVWTRSYGKDDGKTSVGVTIDEIFRQHLTNDLEIEREGLIQLNLEKMATKTHFCCPAWKSQMMFSYLLDFAQDHNNYGNVKFYTTSDSEGNVLVNLRSVNQMFISKDKEVPEFTLVDSSGYESGRLDKPGMTPRNLNQILSHKFVSYDITSLPSGLPGGQLLTYDYKKSRYFTIRENYKEAIARKENPFFQNFALWSDRISNESSKQFYAGEYEKSYARGFLNNKLIEHNKQQLRCQSLTFIDEKIQVGDKIFVIFLSGMVDLMKEQGKLMDEQMSGTWVVEDIADTVINGRGVRTMTVIRDSFFNLYGVSAGIANQPALPQVKPVQG